MLKKNINFQSSKAHINSWLFYMQPTFALPAAAVSKMLGGTWVGGTCEVSQTHIKIYANKSNKFLMSNLDEILIPTTDVKNLELEKGFMTKIIVIHFGNTFIKIRCYDATKFIQDLENTIGFNQ